MKKASAGAYEPGVYEPTAYRLMWPLRIAFREIMKSFYPPENRLHITLWPWEMTWNRLYA